MGRRRPSADGPSGVLLVDKPAGISSAAVVARVRRVLDGVKAGHTGTLDPFATGLLPLCLGEATKLAGYLTDNDKTYEGVIRLGVTTDTLDRTGTVTGTAPVPPLEPEAIAALAREFEGDILQVPPSYSAIKRDGRPMYELARRGEAPELEARPVHVARLELGILDEKRLSVSIDSSKGFYVRSLAQDLGSRLGCGAMLEALRRTRVGRLRLDDAIPLADLEKEGGEALARSALLSLDEALGHLRCVELATAEAAALRLGRQAPLMRISPGQPGETIRLSVAGELVAVALFENSLWGLERVFASPTVSAPCPPEKFMLPASLSPMEEEERNEANRRD
ncbi:MAG: tRNA pseudouridine(55) synthase TruB [Candidatus Binatia bacterium]